MPVLGEEVVAHHLPGERRVEDRAGVVAADQRARRVGEDAEPDQGGDVLDDAVMVDVVDEGVVAAAQTGRHGAAHWRSPAPGRGNSENFANRFTNDTFTVSMGPLRCLARITSAMP